MMLPTDTASNPLLKKRRSLDIFAWMIAISLLLHLTASVIVTLPGSFSQLGAPPVFLELQNTAEAPAPAGSPLEEPAAAEQQQTPAQETAPEPAPEPVAEPAAEAAKLEKAVENSLRRAVTTPDAVHESGIGLGMISGHFSSFGEGASLKDEIRVYYFALMRRINEIWWTSGAERRSFANGAAVNLIISREGKVLSCELLQSSGNREHDKALLNVVRSAEPLPPLPPSFRQKTFSAPIRFVPPLRLMLPGLSDKSKLEIKHGE